MSPALDIYMPWCYYIVVVMHAEVAELADAQDLKSCGANTPYRFDSGLRHHQI